jgi:hypothetical protein
MFNCISLYAPGVPPGLYDLYVHTVHCVATLVVVGVVLSDRHLMNNMHTM